VTSPEGANAGKAHVLVEPELAGFAKAVRRQLDQALAPLGRDMEKQLSRQFARMAPLKLPVAPQLPDRIPPPTKVLRMPVELDPLAKQFQVDLKRELAALTKQVNAEIPVNPATDGLRSELSAELRRLEKQLKVDIPTEVADIRQYERNLRAAVDAAKAHITAEIRTTVDADGITAEARSVKERVQRLISPVKVAVQFDRGRLREGIAQVGSTIAKGIGGLAVAGAATVSVVGLTGAVTALAGAVAVSAGALVGLPSVLLAAGAAGLVAKVGLIGVSDAFKALAEGDAEKLNESLEKLSPNAATFVREFKALQPVLTTIRKQIQDRLFAGLAEQIQPLTDRLLPRLRTLALGVATDLNAAAKQAAGFVRSAATVRDVDRIFAAISTATSRLVPAVAPVLQVFRDLAAVGSAELPRLASGIADAARQFAAFIAAARQSGSLAAFFRSGLDTLAQLGRITKNVTLGIAGIFQAGASEGGNFLDALERMTARFRELVASAGGQQALRQFFADSATVVGALASTVRFVAEKVGQLTAAFGRLPESVKPIIVQVALVGGGIALVVAKLAAFAPVVSGIAGIIGAIGAGPLLAVAAAVTAIGGAFAYAYTQSSAFRTLLSEVFSTIGGIASSAVATVRPALQQFAAIFRDELKPAIDDAINTISTNLRPAFVKLGEVWRSDIQPALAGIVAKLQEAEPELRAFASAAGAVVRFLAGLTSSGPAVALFAAIGAAARVAAAGIGIAINNFRFAVQFIQAVPGFFAGVGEAISGFFSGVASTVSTAGAAIGGFFTALPGRIATALGALASVATAPFRALIAGVQAIVSVGVSGIVAFFAALPGRIIGALLTLLANQITFWGNVVGTARGIVVAGFNAVVSFMAGLPGRIQAAISSLTARVSAIVSATWARARALFAAGVAAAVSFAQQLPGRAASAISSLTGRISAIAAAAWAALRARFTAGVSQAVGIAQSLPGRIAGALSGMAGRFRSIGSDIISGLVSGIRSGVGAVASAARDVAASAVSAAKSALGIGSPSKVMASEVGQWIPAGLAVGVDRNAGLVEEAMLRITQSVVPGVPQLAGVASAGLAAPAFGSGEERHYHLHDSLATIAHLEALDARRNALARVGRPA